MQKLKQTLHKKFILFTMVVVMLTGTITTGYVETVQAETTVYITKTGSKYHTHKCGNGTYDTVSRSTAIAKGKAVVKAKVHGETYSCKVTVKKPIVTGVKQGAYMEEMESMDWQEVQVKMNPSYAIAYYDVSVASSDPSIVSAEVIDDWDEVYIELTSGDVSGKAIITVSIGGETTSFEVEVIGDEEETDETEDNWYGDLEAFLPAI